MYIACPIDNRAPKALLLGGPKHFLPGGPENFVSSEMAFP